MSRECRQLLITGAGGFVGSRLARALLAHPAFTGTRIVLTDRVLADMPDDGRITAVAGDIADAALQRRLVEDMPDTIVHLAGVLGGAAEADYPLARRVNLDATLALMEALRVAERPPRFVFASSVAVFGPSLPEVVDDDTPAVPVMTYGAQKRMIEVALAQFGARGWLDGLALRLPGVVARPDVGAGLKSAFLNTLFHRFAAGEAIVLPVSPEGTTWLLSVGACVDALIHAALLPPSAIDGRVLTLPAQTLSFAALVEALRRAFPASPATVRYAPDPAIEAQFGRQPPLLTPAADAAGFVHDGDADTLVARALAPA